MSSRARIYIASPISKGDVEQNVRRACAAATELIKLGYAPLCPQLTCYLESPVASLSAGFDHETWMEVDLPWVRVAHAVLRLPGESRGADREVKYALDHCIPVFNSIECLKIFGPRPAGEYRTSAANDFCTSASVPPPHAPAAGDPRFHQVLNEMRALHDKKQQDYGSRGDPFANVRASQRWGVPPWVGAMIRANDKVQRLQSFTENGRLANEGVEDSLIDLANYAVIALLLYREQKGKEVVTI